MCTELHKFTHNSPIRSCVNPVNLFLILPTSEKKLPKQRPGISQNPCTMWFVLYIHIWCSDNYPRVFLAWVICPRDSCPRDGCPREIIVPRRQLSQGIFFLVQLFSQGDSSCIFVTVHFSFFNDIWTLKMT